MDETDEPRIQVLEILGPPNDPEMALEPDEQARRQRARWAFSQMCYSLANARFAASVGFQQASGGTTESRATSREMVDSNYKLLRLSWDADSGVRTNLEHTVNQWHGYLQAHAALAENGASIAVNTIDRVMREFVERIGMSYGNITGGPVLDEYGTTMLELMRAGGNWSRHRHQWALHRFKWDDKHENFSVRTLSRCMIYHLDDNVFSQIVQKLPYDTWVAVEESVQKVGRALVAFAYEPPYRPVNDGALCEDRGGSDGE
jgi:hypothetical protein